MAHQPTSDDLLLNENSCWSPAKEPTKESNVLNSIGYVLGIIVLASIPSAYAGYGVYSLILNYKYIKECNDISWQLTIISFILSPILVVIAALSKNKNKAYFMFIVNLLYYGVYCLMIIMDDCITEYIDLFIFSVMSAMVGVIGLISTVFILNYRDKQERRLDMNKYYFASAL